jgi:Protein of unknown function (DUF2778)
LAFGYSGAAEYKNDPQAWQLKDRGPIPCGNYTIEYPRDTPDHGPYALPIVPNPANSMAGRSGFLIHGDNINLPGTASEGCIILPRWCRERVWESNDQYLEVVP